MTKIASTHHAEAAAQLRLAADHQEHAGEHHEQGAHAAAAEHAFLAHGHLVQAVEHADEAAKIHANADRGTEHSG